MGNRIAPLLAIIFLDHIEHTPLTSEILLYKRYVSDVFVIWHSQTEVEKTLERLSACDSNVSFLLEQPGSDDVLYTYMIICAGCGEKYIGETMRTLRRRLDEHRRALANPASYPIESSSGHRTLRHTNEPPPSVFSIVT
ncbi:hypothetical protein Y032_0457g1793 [Ancylostoma ceylanicum]|uniref:GIY-YIG domain-containing protein n=1 Tax=Ancylostoma ceylanicum TaxID=53326 RepID=A0A016WYB8_9BILA|nr:hypothetical protein Y032_0457g1793 [Ancylostoma ceylanicum]